MKKKSFPTKLVFNIFVICLCVGIVCFFFFSEDGLRDLLQSGQGIIWQWIVVAVISQLVYMFTETTVIYLFIRERYKNFSYLNALKVSFTGLFWSAVTPSSTGGQPMQIYLLHSMNVEIGYATSRLMQKFLVYQVVLTFISIISVILNFGYILTNDNILFITVLLVFGFVSQLAVTLVIVMFSFSPNISRKFIMFFAKVLGKIKIVKNLDSKISDIDKQLDTFHSSNKNIYKKPKLLIPAVILTFVQFIAMFLVPYFIYLSFGMTDIGPVQIATSQAFVNLMSGMIPIPGASGAAELGYTAFFGAIFVGGTLKSSALIWRVINYYGVIFATAPFAYLTKDKTDQAKKESNK
ncbi:MAG: lysylphosphatidylglycerol synthase transmembrane domain-containing protein [Oscillospiraceae bacterium]|nr:lysylphosphatidylglycerol synthase transmembrane domain-containing protein [Oscillospiraceae bacterium]